MTKPSNAPSICIPHMRQAMHRAYARNGRTELTKMIGYLVNSSHLSNACARVQKFLSTQHGCGGSALASRGLQCDAHLVIHSLGES